jgi:hypothetical protein
MQNVRPAATAPTVIPAPSRGTAPIALGARGVGIAIIARIVSSELFPG